MPNARPPDRSALGVSLDLPAANDAQAVLAHRLVAFGLACLGLAIVSLAVDLPISRVFLCEAGPVWTEVRQLLRDIVRPAEAFSHGYASIALVLVVCAADIVHRRQGLRTATILLWVGILTNVLKVLVPRIRPLNFFDYELGQFASGVWGSFPGWLSLEARDYAVRSIPSGHATTAVVMAIAMSHRWPHATSVFVVVACMASLQRVFGGSHYVSDCFAGAALACLTAAVVYHPRLVGWWFDRFERRGGQHGAANLSTSPRDSSIAPARIRRAA